MLDEHPPHDVGVIPQQFQCDWDFPSPIIEQSIEESAEATSACPESAQLLGPSPIQRLPVELLYKIFIQCLPHHDFYRPNKYEAPLLLTQICTFWRHISLNTPMLWASLEISTKRQSFDGGTPLLLIGDLNDLWLSRSRQHPLSLSLQVDHVRIDYFVLDTIRCHSSHLRHLKVTVPESYCIFFPDAHLPLLETFVMRTENNVKHDLAQSIFRCLAAAPRLKSFTWTNHFLHPLPIKLNWSNLTHLNLDTVIKLRDCLPIFLEAKIMTHINFGLIMTAGYAVDSPIILPELQSLIIHAVDDSAPVFNAITIPKLKSLATYSRFWPHVSVLAFLQRSACPLESLALYSPYLNDTRFIECLEIVQHTLKEVTAHGMRGTSPLLTDVVLERLMFTGNEHVLCPKIEAIGAYNSISCSPGQFAAMAQSRLEPANIGDVQSESQASAEATRVLSLKVIGLYDDEAEMTYLSPLRDLGLIVKVHSSVTGAEIKTEPDDDLRQDWEDPPMSIYERVRRYVGPRLF